MGKAVYSRTHEQRRREIAAIHAGRRQLGMDDTTYRAMLARVSAEHGPALRSSGEMNARQRRAVLDELRRLGAGRKHAGKPHNFDVPQMPDGIAKVEALLADMKLSWAYADAIALRMHGIAKLAWVRDEMQLAAIIAALHAEKEKRDLNAAIDASLRELDWAPERIVELLSPLRPNWRRHRPSLRLVAEYLATQVTACGDAGAQQCA
ncbi:regulatory protein GemA [Tahibacter soli]|uniref:DUF1018 domain-containing protein n=1 Tax=Tahibacter soli TaxID=2983605 RepID=A0A9X4BIH8_9GAMM|nr:regulatory protein GemA [Tahibacter soli]MDC8012267.1 DUF1018 domain-containing protein [Tahibacter soli]